MPSAGKAPPLYDALGAVPPALAYGPRNEGPGSQADHCSARVATTAAEDIRPNILCITLEVM